MVDYSKWNNIIDSDDEKDFNEDYDDYDDEYYTEEEKNNQPKFTKLDQASSFTIGPSGVSIKNDNNDNNNLKKNPKIESNLPSSSSIINNDINPERKSVIDSLKPTAIKHIDNNEKINNLEPIKLWSKNGNNFDKYIWSQNSKEVSLKIRINGNIKASKINVTLKDKYLHISLLDTKEILLDGILKYDIIENDINEDDCVVDWEIRSYPEFNNCRMLEISLYKKSPIVRAILWWNCLFNNEPEIEVMSIKERKKDSEGNIVNQNVWAEAHQMFQDKMKDYEPTIINDDDDQM
jgi:hypothetical protein